jgi:hypothetical protein
MFLDPFNDVENMQVLKRNQTLPIGVPGLQLMMKIQKPPLTQRPPEAIARIHVARLRSHDVRVEPRS